MYCHLMGYVYAHLVAVDLYRLFAQWIFRAVARSLRGRIQTISSYLWKLFGTFHLFQC